MATFYSKQNNLDVVQFGSGAAALTGLNIRVGGDLHTPQKINFGPQVGFAWQPMESNGKLVVRGGFGINYNQNEIAITGEWQWQSAERGSGELPLLYPYNDPTCGTPAFSMRRRAASTRCSAMRRTRRRRLLWSPTICQLAGGNRSSCYGFNPRQKTITNYHYSLDTQYQLPYDTVASPSATTATERVTCCVQSNY